MNQSEQPAVKDEDAEHPVASAWRSTFREIVSAFARGDYRLERGIASVEPISASTAKQISDYIAEYGETLGEGRSDLVLGARVYETETGYRYRIGIVYVP